MIRTTPHTVDPCFGSTISTQGAVFPPSFATLTWISSEPTCSWSSTAFAKIVCTPFGTECESHASLQDHHVPLPEVSSAVYTAPSRSIRIVTTITRWSSVAFPVMFTIPLTVAPSSGAVITTWGASSSGFSTRTTMDVSAARLELSYATATMWCHPFAHRVVSHVQDQVHHDPLPDVSVARLLSPASIPTSTFTTSPSGSHAFPVTSIVPLTVVPGSGLVIATCGLISARPT